MRINRTFAVKRVASPGFRQKSYSAELPKTKTFGVIVFGNEYNFGTGHELRKNDIHARLGLWMDFAAQWSDKHSAPGSELNSTFPVFGTFRERLLTAKSNVSFPHIFLISGVSVNVGNQPLWTSLHKGC